VDRLGAASIGYARQRTTAGVQRQRQLTARSRPEPLDSAAGELTGPLAPEAVHGRPGRVAADPRLGEHTAGLLARPSEDPAHGTAGNPEPQPVAGSG
jgi:hypothetical protein